MPTGYYPVSPTGGKYENIVLAKGDIVTGLDFVNSAYIPVKIDIVPFSSCNLINKLFNSPVPVAVYSSATFDATTIIPSTVDLAGAAPVKSCKIDLNCDGKKDLLLWFYSKNLDLNETSTSATLFGDTTFGGKVTGSDSVKVLTWNMF